MVLAEDEDEDGDDESDKENDNQTIITSSVCSRRVSSSVGRRTQAGNVHKRSLSVSSNKSKTSTEPKTFSLSEGGRQDIRAVWIEFESRIKSSHGRVKWNLCEDDFDSEKERNSNRTLMDHWSVLTNCCFSGKKLRQLSDDVGSQFDELAKSPAGLLRHRLECLERVAKLNRGSWKLYVTEQLRGSQQNQIQWCRATVCDECFLCLVGVSRSTSYRWLNPTEPKLKMMVDDINKNKTAQLAQELLAMSEADRQFLPTSKGMREDKAVRVLPYKTQTQCIEALQQRLSTHSGRLVTVCRATFQRAVQHLDNEQKIILSMKASKELARCKECEALENKYREAKIKNQQLGDQRFRIWHEHLKEAAEQRALFEEKKRWALREPWEINVCTLDAMDCSKTSLPHYTRQTKDPRTEDKLNMRVVGAFYFGGPIPCIGITSFDNVPSKGGAAAVTNLEKIIDMQYERMDPNNIAPIPDKINASKSNAASDSQPPIHSSSSVSGTNDDGAPIGNVDSNVSHGKTGIDRSKKQVPFMWPRGLHVTFDNTAGDCKNAHLFRFLGMLVAAGVFMYITVSTLLVGHTHDIVDQMFSCWARALTKHDAHSLSELHRLFRRKYSTGIYALEEYAKKKSTGQLSDRLVAVANELGVDPEIVHQSFCIDAQSWCYKPIKQISSPHVFYIRKETIMDPKSNELCDVIVMYNKFLAKSHLDTSVRHNPEYANVEFGPWTTRTVLLEMDELPNFDPNRLPPQLVETDKVRGCVDCHYNSEKNMTKEEKAEMSNLLDAFHAEFDNMAEDCETCGELMTKLNRIGTISERHDATPEQKAFAKEQKNSKRNIKNDLQKHLNDTPHASLRANGWWKKWLDRVTNVISPYYKSRELIVDVTPEQRAESGRAQHPADLVRDDHEPPLRENRVDQHWLKKNGPPQLNHIVVTRVSTKESGAMQPFGIGRIKAVLDADGVTIEGEVVKSNCHSKSKSKSKRPAASSAREGRASKAQKSGRNQDVSGAANNSPKKFTIEWFNFIENKHAKNLKLLDLGHWRSELGRVSAVDLGRWNEAHELMTQGKFCRLPKAAVDRWQNVQFKRDTNWDDSIVDLEELIVWSDNLLTGTGRIAGHIWKRVVEDLCETTDIQHQMAIDYVAQHMEEEEKMQT